MKNVKIVFEYDGSDFFGFQRQDDVRTIQGEIEHALSKITGEKIEITAAGRTDRGVHAINQTANFLTTSPIPPERYFSILNKWLPEGIRVKSSEKAEADFNSRFSAKSRKYLYIMKNKREFNVFEKKYITYVEDDIDVEKFVEILKPLIGRHNFDSFRKSDCNAHSPVREIKSIEMIKENGAYKFYIRADGFLKSMVRIIVGYGLAVYFGEKPADYVQNGVENPNNGREKPLAPPNGLYLYEVEY